MSAPDLNAAWSRALLSELFRAGARDAVICPGARSSPLAVGAASMDGLRTFSVVDERSAAFFALGLSRASRRPTLVVATSGSAGAHFLPAVIEASMSGVPLVLLTADRPWELHDFGAPQTIPQEGLFGRFVCSAEALPVPEASDASFLHLRAVVARAVHRAVSGRGPVHFNVPFREPLAPTGGPPPALGQLALEGRGERPFLEFASPSAASSSGSLAWEDVAARMLRCERGIIVCGPRAPEAGFAEALRALSRASGYPLFVEAASNARFGLEAVAVAHYEALLAHEPFARGVRPELVLRFGGGLTSKRLQQWIDASDADVVAFSESTETVIDPGHRASLVVGGSGLMAARELVKALHGGVDAGGSADSRAGAVGGERAWAAGIAEAERRARLALQGAFAGASSQQLTEPSVARELAARLPPGAPLFVSSSMPIRDLDAFASPTRPPLQVHANRGANGIDGILSTAAGIAAASGRPAALLTGDLAFLHDLGGLLLARRHRLSLAIIVVNNDGGGIFSFLPIAGTTPHFEDLFGTPHGIELRHAAALADARYHGPATVSDFGTALSLALEGGLHVIEVKVPPREENPGLHRALWARVAAELGEGPWA